MYEAKALKELGRLPTRHSNRHGHPAYMLADEPYRQLVYDDLTLHSIFAAYPNTLLVTSFPRTSPFPGGEIFAGLVLTNRILGFVNTPALMQRVVANMLEIGAFYFFSKAPVGDSRAGASGEGRLLLPGLLCVGKNDSASGRGLRPG